MQGFKMFKDDPQRFLILELKEKVAVVMEQVSRVHELNLLTELNHAIDNLLLNQKKKRYRTLKNKFRKTLQELALKADACVNMKIRTIIIPILNNLIEWTDDTL